MFLAIAVFFRGNFNANTCHSLYMLKNVIRSVWLTILNHFTYSNYDNTK